MSTQPMELLSAFLDGEDTDPAALAEALTTPGARELLRDFARIRAGVRAGDESPSREFYERMAAVIEPPGRGGFWSRSFALPLPLAASIALVGAVLLTRVVVGPGPAPGTDPPEPDRTIEFVRGVDWSGLD